MYAADDAAITGPKHLFERTDGRPLHEDATLFVMYMDSWLEKRCLLYYCQYILESYGSWGDMPPEYLKLYLGANCLANDGGYDTFQRHGIGPKYRVKRIDGKPMKGIPYFVFEIDSDPFARAALERYAAEGMPDAPRFSKSLKELVDNQTWRGYGVGLFDQDEGEKP